VAGMIQLLVLEPRTCVFGLILQTVRRRGIARALLAPRLPKAASCVSLQLCHSL